MLERFHRTLNTMLAKVVSESQKDWDLWIPQVMSAYRASPHAATGYSPNFIVFGRENRMPIDIVAGDLLGLGDSTLSTNEFVAVRQARMMQAYELVRNRLRTTANRRKEIYNLSVKALQFNHGNKVWYFYPRRYVRKSQKWQFFYVGPYTVVERLSSLNYSIQKSPKEKPIVVHVDKLKRYYPRFMAAVDTPASGSVSSVQYDDFVFAPPGKSNMPAISKMGAVPGATTKPKKKLCTVCGKAFVRRRGVILHMETTHNPNPPSFPCNLCQRVYARRDNLIRHKRINHPRGEAQAAVLDDPALAVDRLSHPVGMENPSPSTPTMDEHDAAMDEVVVATLPPLSGTSDLYVGHVTVDPDNAFVRGSLNQRLEHLEEEWMTKEVPVSVEQSGAGQPFPRDFRSPSASERALALNMVASVVRGVMNASLGESLHVLKRSARQQHPEFGFIAELVAQAAVEARREENTRQRSSLVRGGSKKDVAVQTSRKTGEGRLPHDLTEAFGRRWLDLNAHRVPGKKRQGTFPGKPRHVRKAPLPANATISATERDSTALPISVASPAQLSPWTELDRQLDPFLEDSRVVFQTLFGEDGPITPTDVSLSFCPLICDGAEVDGMGEPMDGRPPFRDEDRLDQTELGSTTRAD